MANACESDQVETPDEVFEKICDVFGISKAMLYDQAVLNPQFNAIRDYNTYKNTFVADFNFLNFAFSHSQPFLVWCCRQFLLGANIFVLCPDVSLHSPLIVKLIQSLSYRLNLGVLTFRDYVKPLKYGMQLVCFVQPGLIDYKQARDAYYRHHGKRMPLQIPYLKDTDTMTRLRKPVLRLHQQGLSA